VSQDFFRERTLKTKTGKIRAAMAIDLAKLAGSVATYFLSGREPADRCNEQRPAERFRPPVDLLTFVIASDAKSGHLSGVRRPECI